MTAVDRETARPGAPAMFADYPELLEPCHISEITGLNVVVVRRMCKRGALPAVKIGSRWFVPRPSLIEYVTAPAKP